MIKLCTSNHLASITCYASAYSRWLLIDEYFSQWDDDKYATLSKNIYDNFRQACDIINTETPALSKAMTTLGINSEDLKQWYEEERHYFKNIGKETPWDVHAMAYVEALKQLQDLTRKLDVVSDNFLVTIPSNYQFQLPASHIYQRIFTLLMVQPTYNSVIINGNPTLADGMSLEVANPPAGAGGAHF
ncbi:hypothetical protein EVJ58_g7712 [Rhodofomes roseus]|uniref:Uncharacterized protein n=1 Tax=Rhodofomes roseus TaxID=34475 RepID=A0A4Y9Y1I5_9APHY|nr:hypothetical protein EVJ58_g7712 [Rhodofomes roseus]